MPDFRLAKRLVKSLDKQCTTMESNNGGIDERLWNKELATRLNNGIKQAFSFPFLDKKQCQPDDSKHYVRDRTFHLQDHLVVLNNIRLFPGFSCRALEVNSGELNVFSHDVKFELDIPTIAGFFYVISKNNSVKQSTHIKGTFKINYGAAIAQGIASYFLNVTALGILNMAIDFELVGKPKVVLNSQEANGFMGIIDLDRDGNGHKIAEILWPSTRYILYWLLRDKLWTVSSEIPWTDKLAKNQFYYHEERRRSKAAELLKGIVAAMKQKLAEKTDKGRLEMPDIDVMIAPKGGPHTWGRFQATSGWLGNIESITVNDHTMVHARSHNELVIVGLLGFSDWKYTYDKYTVTANTGNTTGNLEYTLDENEATITITAIRTNEGKIILKLAKFEYTCSYFKFPDNTSFGYSDWLLQYVDDVITGLMEDKKSALNDLINECLNEVIDDFDMFSYWDEMNQHPATVGIIIGPERTDRYRLFSRNLNIQIPDYSGEIFQTLEDSEALITITATRNGPVVIKVPKFQYTNATNTNTDVLGADDFEWLKMYVEYWMSSLVDAGKPALHELIDANVGNVVAPPIGFILQ